MKKRRKRRKKFAIPNQTSFGGSLGFGSSETSSFSSLLEPTPPRPTGNFIWNVDFINHTSIVGDTEFVNGVAVLQTQINRDFLPAWSIGAKLNIVTQPRGNATVYVLDTTSDAGILGYHDISQTEIPVGFVFAKTAKADGDTWQNTASHELMELLVDPFANLAAEGTFVGSPAFFAYECCDPVEGDEGYVINGVTVANFVFPAWFLEQTSKQYDFLKSLDAPFTIGSGGTLSYFRAVGDWTDVTSNQFLPKIHGKFTRRFRRRKRSNPNYGVGYFPPKVVPHPHTHD